ncbi:MAG: cytochrome c biogenesis protein CcdA [Rhodospirillales bacterium]
MFDLSNLSIFTVFAAGLISFVSPCVLPLVPGYISYIAGRSLPDGPTEESLSYRLPAIGLSSCFVLGFSTVFVILGASATALGQLLLTYRYELNIVGGVIVIAFGLLMIGVLQPVWTRRDIRFHLGIPGGRPISAYILGLAFGFGWTPCIGPILGAILTVSFASATVTEGITLLAIYSLGLGVPFLLSAVLAGRMVRGMSALRRTGRYIQIAAGGIMILMGIAMITGRLTELSYWMLDTFPILGSIG